MTSLEPCARSLENGNPSESQRVSGGRQLSRSPHPYHRRGVSVLGTDGALDGRTSPSGRQQRLRPSSISSSGSGTEADDERGSIFLKRLTAPPLRARKGLRGGTPVDQTPIISPLPTPPANEKASQNSFFERSSARHRKFGRNTQDEDEIREKYTRQKRAELTRRIAETSILVTVAYFTYLREGISSILDQWRPELLSFLVLVSLLYMLYPVRRTFNEMAGNHSLQYAYRIGFRIPSRFDPGPLLYPVFLPCLIAMSLANYNADFVLPNIILGLSSLPEEVIPGLESFKEIHWLATTLPLLVSANPATSNMDHTPLMLKVADSESMTADILVLLYPAHKALLQTIKYLTTTSLDQAEIYLLATGLINLFLFSATPQMQILKALLWLGGILLFCTCQKVLGWEVALARVPSWKFQRKIKSKSSLLEKVDDLLSKKLTGFDSMHRRRASSGSQDFEQLRRPFSVPNRARLETKLPLQEGSLLKPDFAIYVNGAIEFVEIAVGNSSSARPSRRNTFSVIEHKSNTPPTTTPGGRPKRTLSPEASSFTTLTRAQAETRKWIYALYVYVGVFLIVMLPIRSYISVQALALQEPFGWAVSYLFGQLPQMRTWICYWGLEGWISLPRNPDASTSVLQVGLIEHVRQHILGPANMRLAISVYCLLILAVGIAALFRLTSIVEVDTRRKVFHGIMVAMLLPTIFIDPCFIALALALILAIFLLLDLFRASQLPPISKPLTHFLAPYVDGRDHRGPVIVSHMFLLIGCAIPLWLSLAGYKRGGEKPWAGWELLGRDISMVSGVICVGMGDAAASLIGRRYGRTKWHWGGGKSLEGSLAFAVAVTLGLMAAHVWMQVGGWAAVDLRKTGQASMKMMVAAAGASLNEATLTSCNDNVVVPIMLWLLVRSLGI